MRLAQLVIRPELAPQQHRLNDASLAHLLLELLRQLALGTEILCNKSHRLLRLGVKGGILNEAANEDPHVVFDLLWRDLYPRLILLVNAVSQSLHHHVRYMVYMLAALEGGDAVDKAYLLKALVGDTDGNLPPSTTLVVSNLEGIASIIKLVLGEETNIVLEGVHWNSLAIEVDLDSPRRCSNVESSPAQDSHHIWIELL